MVSPIKLMITKEAKFQGKALSLSHTKTAISTIKEKFSLQQLRRFEESCFGHLLLIEDLQWTSPIVHGLLLRKADLKTVSQVNEIKFIVGNKVIQFTVRQFCVVTGLRFGNLPFIPIATNENCSLKRKYFYNDKTVSLLELEKAFLDCADEDDAFKLGFVYFVVFVLLSSEKHVHIDMQYLKMAEDLEEFVKYPWGAVYYAKTNASLLRALCADYQGVKIWAYKVFSALAALHFVVHEENAYIPRILNWKSNTSAHFHELMSQVFENCEVDVQLLCPTVIDKQQPYWTWGDNVDDTEEIVELFGDDAEEKTSTFASVEEKDDDIDETATLLSSSKGKVQSTELRTLKRDFQRTKDELAKVARSNQALRNRVHDLEEMVRKESLKLEKECAKNKKCGGFRQDPRFNRTLF
ncbi:hypothetical protein GBA52_024916 [Prunus armeniaca]|nr:hypothetical protein GBA52_024916 [Prunus armeniaca]